MERPYPFQPGAARVSCEHGRVNDEPVIALYVHTDSTTLCTMWTKESLANVVAIMLDAIDNAPPSIVIADALPHHREQ